MTIIYGISTLYPMGNRIQKGGLQVASELARFIDEELLPSVQLSGETFWSGFESLIYQLSDRNQQLLHTRNQLQEKIDHWHRSHPGKINLQEYKKFLREISYLIDVGDDFSITTENIDNEIAVQAGPQLVVPVKNARFALNAANARWGSLYDALYGTDVIPETDGAERTGEYNPIRGAKVIEYAREFLDLACPLVDESHKSVLAYSIVQGELQAKCDSSSTTLQDNTQLKGYRGQAEQPSSFLFLNNNLHIEIQIDPKSQIGQTDKAGVKDIVLEAAITAIQYCEDSVAAVDAADKVDVYRNWLGLIRGDLKESFLKTGSSKTRVLEKDRDFTSLNGESFSLQGRSLLLVRNVGHLMRNPAIIDGQGKEVFEGIMDAVITAAVGSIDVNKLNLLSNSRCGSIYIVKPKMHGPDEVAFTSELFAAVEKLLDMAPNTIKVGIMDEERRTSVNLKECIRAAKDRVVFINTGFLDRTGDEIHTSMAAGAMVPKAEMKTTAWISSYEDNNVDVGLACGLQGRAQIGKGMWAMPDLMARMMDEKIDHPMAGANTAWVPSPTAAVLHALHYHHVNVQAQQEELRSRTPASLDELLTIPVLEDPLSQSAEKIQHELDNNAQGILGYVVRWIDQGIGCSKVPDIDNIGLMEDRATLRISSQHITNWIVHKVCSESQVRQTLEKMAAVVDQQNVHDPLYQAMVGNFENSIAFQAACDLVFKGTEQPNGYTEPLLHARRIKKKTS